MAIHVLPVDPDERRRQLERVAEAYVIGELSVRELAVLYMVSYQTIARWLDMTGTPRREPKGGRWQYGVRGPLQVRQEVNGELRRKYYAGRSVASLSAEYGVAYVTMHRWLRQAGVVFRRRGGNMWAKHHG